MGNVEQWLRLYLSALILVPLGVFCVVFGAVMPAYQAPMAITLMAVGTVMLFFGTLGPRFEGAFHIGALGSPAALSRASAARLVEETLRARLGEAAEARQLTESQRQAVEAGVQAASARLPQIARRGAYGRPSRLRVTDESESAELQAMVDTLVTAALATVESTPAPVPAPAPAPAATPPAATKTPPAATAKQAPADPGTAATPSSSPLLSPRPRPAAPRPVRAPSPRTSGNGPGASTWVETSSPPRRRPPDSRPSGPANVDI